MFWTLAVATALFGGPSYIPRPAQVEPLRTLIVGGGPDKKHNQAAIESNVRYLTRVLPLGASRRILFADGDPSNHTVQWQDSDAKIHYRVPELAQIDGASQLSPVQEELSHLAVQDTQHPTVPTLLYFTGHGSPGGGQNFDNNDYDLWGGGGFNVRSLAKSLTEFPKETPVTLVMVECFSGAFANVLFEDGSPSMGLADRNLCGFFASLPNRMAAGCTPEINEANYRDFTGYFFAALSGKDRLGRPVDGVDYNHDGVVGMDEAYAYALAHDESIDTPMCTSDVFVRHFAKLSNEVINATTYPTVLRWSTPAQRYALETLSASLKLEGDDRVANSYNQMQQADLQASDLPTVRLFRFERLARSIILGHELETHGDKEIRARYRALLKLERSNPLVPQP